MRRVGRLFSSRVRSRRSRFRRTCRTCRRRGSPTSSRTPPLRTRTTPCSRAFRNLLSSGSSLLRFLNNSSRLTYHHLLHPNRSLFNSFRTFSKNNCPLNSNCFRTSSALRRWTRTTRRWRRRRNNNRFSCRSPQSSRRGRRA